MTKSFYIFLLIINGLISCQTEENTNIRAIENYETKPFPKIIDTNKVEDFDVMKDYKDANWLSTSVYKLLYIGSYRDTLIINQRLGNSRLYPEGFGPEEFNDPINDYFIDWRENKQYKYWHTARIEVKIDTTTKLHNDYPILLTNLESESILIGYEIYLPLIMEAKDSTGEWKPIEEPLLFASINGVDSIFLPPQQIVLTSAPIFTGSYKTDLRLSIGNNYSAVFKGNIQYQQFESRFNNQDGFKKEYKSENGK